MRASGRRDWEREQIVILLVTAVEVFMSRPFLTRRCNCAIQELLVVSHFSLAIQCSESDFLSAMFSISVDLATFWKESGFCSSEINTG